MMVKTKVSLTESVDQKVNEYRLIISADSVCANVDSKVVTKEVKKEFKKDIKKKIKNLGR